MLPKTIEYECVGGPRDGARARVRRDAHAVTLDGATYRVRWFVKRDERGLRLWERECLVWDAHPAETSAAAPQIEDAAAVSPSRARVVLAERARVVLEDRHGEWWLVRRHHDALLFVAYDERRWIRPVPKGWQQLAAAELEALLHDAPAIS